MRPCWAPLPAQLSWSSSARSVILPLGQRARIAITCPRCTSSRRLPGRTHRRCLSRRQLRSHRRRCRWHRQSALRRVVRQRRRCSNCRRRQQWQQLRRRRRCRHTMRVRSRNSSSTRSWPSNCPRRMPKEWARERQSERAEAFVCIDFWSQRERAKHKRDRERERKWTICKVGALCRRSLSAHTRSLFRSPALQPHFPYFADSAHFPSLPGVALWRHVDSTLHSFLLFANSPASQQQHHSLTLLPAHSHSQAIHEIQLPPLWRTAVHQTAHTHTDNTHSTRTYSPAVQCNCAGMRASKTAIVCAAHLTKGDDNSSSNWTK